MSYGNAARFIIAHKGMETKVRAITQITQITHVTKPVITLTGNATENVANGASYTDAGATASDNVDGILTSSIVVTITNNVNAGTTFNATVSGTYTYHYNVSDAAGNAALEVTRTVVVSALFTISKVEITGVTVPVTGAMPVSIIVDTTEYTATIIAWSPTAVTFARGRVYFADFIK